MRDYSECTIGAAFFSKKLFLKEINITVNLQLWDTAGQGNESQIITYIYSQSDGEE
jgi:hypothetical protein